MDVCRGNMIMNLRAFKHERTMMDKIIDEENGILMSSQHKVFKIITVMQEEINSIQKNITDRHAEMKDTIMA